MFAPSGAHLSCCEVRRYRSAALIDVDGSELPELQAAKRDLHAEAAIAQAYRAGVLNGIHPLFALKGRSGWVEATIQRLQPELGKKAAAQLATESAGSGRNWGDDLVSVTFTAN